MIVYLGYFLVVLLLVVLHLNRTTLRNWPYIRLRIVYKSGHVVRKKVWAYKTTRGANGLSFFECTWWPWERNRFVYLGLDNIESIYEE